MPLSEAARLMSVSIDSAEREASLRKFSKQQPLDTGYNLGGIEWGDPRETWTACMQCTLVLAALACGTSLLS